MLKAPAQGLESVYFLEHNMACVWQKMFHKSDRTYEILFNSMYKKLIIILKIVSDFKTI